MAKRYYICRVIGDGSRETPYNSELRQYVQSTWQIKFLQQAIYAPYLIWVIMKYDLAQLQHDGVMANVPQLFSFPAGALDRNLSEISTAKRNAIRDKLENIGFDFDWVTGTNTIRDVLKYLFHSTQLASWAQIVISNKNFDVNTTVANIPVGARQRIAQHMSNLEIDASWIIGSHTIRDIVTKVMFRSDNSPRLFGVGVGIGKQLFWHDEDSE